jgi:prolyl oligopeptidase
MNKSRLPADSDDPYLWLEDVDGKDALAWVAAQNARTLEALAGPDFERDREAFRAILSASDKIPYILKRGPHLYNLWQDKDNPRGLWRRTSIESYRSPSIEWDVVIDIDALGRFRDSRARSRSARARIERFHPSRGQESRSLG